MFGDNVQKKSSKNGAKSGSQYESIDEMADAFVIVYKHCLKEADPKWQVK